MVQWFEKSSASSGSYKDSVKSLATSFVRASSPERKPVRFGSSRRSCYGSITSPESDSVNTIQRSNDNFSRRVTSPAYSQSTNSSDVSSECGSYSNYSSRPSTPVMSYSVRDSRASTPVRNNESIPMRSYRRASCITDAPIRFYSNPSSQSTAPMRSHNGYKSRDSSPTSSRYQDIVLPNNPSSRSTTPMRTSYTPSSRASTPLGSYYNSSSQHETPLRSYNGYTSRDSSPTPTRSSSSIFKDIALPNNPSSRSTTPNRRASCITDAPIRFYDNPSSQSTASMRSHNGYTSRDSSPSSSRYQDMALPNNPSSRSTTPMRTFYTPSSRATTPLGSYCNSSSRSGTPLRSHTDYASRDSSPTPTISAPNESILNPIQNRRSSSRNRDLPLPKSRADIIVPLKYYFTDVSHTQPTSQQCRSSSRSRSSCNGEDSSQTNSVNLRCRSSSRSRSTCNGDTPQSRSRDMSLPRPKTVYSSTESSQNESDLHTLPRLSRRRGSYIETNSRSSSIARDMIGSSESIQNLINLPATKDIETRVRASMRSKLSLPTTNSDNIRSRKARSQYLSGVIDGNKYQDENGIIYLLN